TLPREPFKNLSLASHQEGSLAIPVYALKGIFEKSRRGSQIQKLFESLRFQPELWDSAPEEFSQELEFVKSVQDVPLLKILSHGEINWRYTLNSADGRQNGQIDAWARVEDEVWLLDYNQGKLRGVEKSFQQLQEDAQ